MLNRAQDYKNIELENSRGTEGALRAINKGQRLWTDTKAGVCHNAQHVVRVIRDKVGHYNGRIYQNSMVIIFLPVCWRPAFVRKNY